MRIVNATTGSEVCDRAAQALSMRARLIGLLGKPGLVPGEGLLIASSCAVHTLGMRFAIDVLALDAGLRVLALRAEMLPSRMAFFSWKTRKVLELPAGQIDRTGICVGDQLLISVPG